MLLGEFMHTVDAKGRVFLPAKWRTELSDEVVVTAGQERCLFVMTTQRFEQRAEHLQQHSSDRKANRDYNRLFFSSASEEAIDKSGRMSIPAGLRQYAELGKEVAFIGVSDRAEIWDRDAWLHYKEGVESEYEAIAEQLD
ncbi:MAG: division/cell wall cluster transcriptional repressor MraZ [Actinobacteria bacterium]|nr:division/cell wall cluster transcriptional repressor MraZ [Actinomycetota bacterium]